MKDYSTMDRAQMGEFYLERVAAFAAENPSRPKHGIVMVGDSITQGFDAGHYFPGADITNRGISGDRLIGVILRQEESIYQLDPAKLFLLIGVNDAALFPQDMPMDEFERQYRYLFSNIKHHCPKCDVYIQSIMPIRGTYAAANPLIVQVNDLLRKLAKEYRFHFVDTHAAFRDASGEMRPELADDGVHPNAKGCALWAEQLRPYMEKRH